MAIKVANNQSLTAITALPASITGGAMTLLETQTASSSSTISFTSNIDSTYDEYVFKFYDIHPATDNKYLSFQVDTGTNTNYNQTITSTFFQARHDEADSDSDNFGYSGSSDQAQGTSFEKLSAEIGNDNDQSLAGTLTIYDPSSSVFVKHFIATTNVIEGSNYTWQAFKAGYINTATAITRVQFKMSSGNMDSGVIKLYGIK